MLGLYSITIIIALVSLLAWDQWRIARRQAPIWPPPGATSEESTPEGR